MERFSTLAYEFFDDRGTHPIVLTWRPRDDVSALNIEAVLAEALESELYTVVVASAALESTYWDGVLLELPDATAPVRGPDGPEGEGLIHSIAQRLTDSYIDADVEVKLATGDSACSSASLESVADSHFGFERVENEYWTRQEAE